MVVWRVVSSLSSPSQIKAVWHLGDVGAAAARCERPPSGARLNGAMNI